MPLQRAFRGLSDHIGSFLGGNVTQELSPVLQQVISAEDFLNPYEWIRTTSAITGAGQIASTPAVPDGELHRIRWLCFEGINTGGTNTLLPVVNPDAIQFAGLTTNTPPSSFGPNVRWYSGVDFNPPLVLPAGGQLGWAIIAHSAGTLNVDVVVLRQRIKI